MSEYKEQVQFLLESLTAAGPERIQSVCNLLGYNLVRNPVNPESPWMMFEHPHFDMSDQAVVAAIADDTLNEDTTIRELRQRFSQVQDLQHEISASYRVEICMFVGIQRIILFKALSDNRDDRLDLSLDSVSRVGAYATYFIEKLSVTHIQIEEDDLGLGYEVQGLDRLFERELSSRFNYVVELYRKKIAEAIVSSHELRAPLMNLVPKDTATLIERKRLAEMVENDSFKVAIGCVVDTIVLRQLLRRFLEAYHGIEQFNTQRDLRTLGLGVGEGRLEDVLHHLVEVYFKDVDDDAWKKTVQKSQQTEQLELALFDEQEEQVTATVSFKRSEEELIEFYYQMREQFELAYGGDLFAGSVSSVTNQIEDLLNMKHPQLLPKLWADTSTQYYNFRYEDLSPKFLQNQYEQSMSRAIQIQWNEEGKPVVFYGEDLQEQKTKGAYYTDDQLVQYMVSTSLGNLFQTLHDALKLAITKQNAEEIDQSLRSIVNLRCVDITCGGGSFLRGAFQYLAKSREVVVRTIEKYEKYDEIVRCYPMFEKGSDGQCVWEQHILLSMLYGIDIDYKALIIASQTLTLSALRNWPVDQGFAQLIGLTLIHQNSLFNPIPFHERMAAFQNLKSYIARLIMLRSEMRKGEWQKADEAEALRLELQAAFKEQARQLFGTYTEMFHAEVLELNIPEIFFNEEGEWMDGGFDIALGNPPWEIWKLNADEFFESYDVTYRKANKQKKEQLEKQIFTKHRSLKKRWESLQEQYAIGSKYLLNPTFYEYQKWKVDDKFTGGDINLYKIALERFYQLLRKGGYASILVPGNIATDRGTTGLRHLLLEQVSLTELLSFENRKKIFASVDSRFKIALVSFIKRKPIYDHSFKAFFYRHDLADLYKEDTKFSYSLKLAEQGAPDTLSLIEFRDDAEKRVVEKLFEVGFVSENWPRLQFTSDFHMSGESSLFRYDGLGLPLLEGKDIHQYTTQKVSDGTVLPELGIKRMKDKESFRLRKMKVNLSDEDTAWYGDYHRIAFRAIASSTNKRTLIATIIPKRVFLTDRVPATIPVMYNKTTGQYEVTLSGKQLLLATGIMNSFVVDFVLRRKVGTTINLFYIYQLPILNIETTHPFYNEIVRRVAKLICHSSAFDELAKEGGLAGAEEGLTDLEARQDIQNQIDAMVAYLYGLNREELIYILKTFESAKHKHEMQDIAQGVIEQFDILQEGGTLTCR